MRVDPKRSGWRLEILLVIGLLVAALEVRRLAAERTAFDSDEAVQGLMAKHIAEGRHFPLMEYGSSHHGALGSYFVALLFRWTGRRSVALLRFYGIGIWMAAAILLYLTARCRFGRVAAFFTLILFCFPSIEVLRAAVKMYPGQAETQLVISALLYWVLGLRRESRRQSRLDFPAGFLMGLILWLTPAALPGIFCIWVYSVYQSGREKSIWEWIKKKIKLFLGFLLGYSPVFLYHLFHRNTALLGFLTQSVPTLRSASDRVLILVLRGLADFLGLTSQEDGDPSRWMVGLLLYLGLLALLFIAIRRNERRAWDKPMMLFLISYVALYLALLLIPRWNLSLEVTPRYLFPTIPPLVLFLGSSLAWKRGQWIAVKCGIIAGFWFWIWSPYPGDLQQDYLARDRLLVEALQSRGVTHLLADYWTAYKVVFLSDERIIASPQGGPIVVDRYPAYTDQVFASPSPAYLLIKIRVGDLTPVERLREFLMKKQYKFFNEDYDGLSLFWKIEPKVLPSEAGLVRFGDIR